MADEGYRPPAQAKRSGVFLGGYVPASLKRWLQERADNKSHTLTQEMIEIFNAARRTEASPKPALESPRRCPACRAAGRGFCPH
jgi:hypothetical protein